MRLCPRQPPRAHPTPRTSTEAGSEPAGLTDACWLDASRLVRPYWRSPPPPRSAALVLPQLLPPVLPPPVAMRKLSPMVPTTDAAARLILPTMLVGGRPYRFNKAGGTFPANSCKYWSEPGDGLGAGPIRPRVAGCTHRHIFDIGLATLWKSANLANE